VIQEIARGGERPLWVLAGLYEDGPAVRTFRNNCVQLEPCREASVGMNALSLDGRCLACSARTPPAQVWTTGEPVVRATARTGS